MEATVQVRIALFPEPDCFERAEGERAAIRHLSQECDSSLDLVINGKNLLSGYDGAFVYPTFAFLRSTAFGLRQLLKEGEATIRVFLQQFSFSSESPCHELHLKVDKQNPRQARASFEWYSHIAKPANVPNIQGEVIEIEELVSAWEKNAKLFEQRTREVLLPLFSNIAGLLDELFATLPDVRQEWIKHVATNGR